MYWAQLRWRSSPGPNPVTRTAVTTLPSTMTGVLLVGHGGFDRLVYRTDLPVPIPGAGEVLVRVRAAGVNNTDINMRTGWYSKSVTERATAVGGGGGPVAVSSAGAGRAGAH